LGERIRECRYRKAVRARVARKVGFTGRCGAAQRGRHAQSGVEARSHACRRNEKTVGNYARWNRPGAKEGKEVETPNELSHVSPSGGLLRRTPGAIANRGDDLQAAAWFLIKERISSSSMSAFTPLPPGRSKTSSWGDSAKLSVGVRISPRKSRTGFVVFPMT
jgi:hypothetical protein